MQHLTWLAVAFVTGKGSYKGAVKVKFTIKKAKGSKLSTAGGAGGARAAQGGNLVAASI